MTEEKPRVINRFFPALAISPRLNRYAVVTACSERFILFYVNRAELFVVSRKVNR